MSMDEEIPKRRTSVETPFINKHQLMQCPPLVYVNQIPSVAHLIRLIINSIYITE